MPVSKSRQIQFLLCVFQCVWHSSSVQKTAGVWIITKCVTITQTVLRQWTRWTVQTVTLGHSRFGSDTCQITHNHMRLIPLYLGVYILPESSFPTHAEFLIKLAMCNEWKTEYLKDKFLPSGDFLFNSFYKRGVKPMQICVCACVSRCAVHRYDLCVCWWNVSQEAKPRVWLCHRLSWYFGWKTMWWEENHTFFFIRFKKKKRFPIQVYLFFILSFFSIQIFSTTSQKCMY